jgi:hemolysin activation/secretion protein
MAGYDNKKCGGTPPASIPLAGSKPLLCTILASFISAPGWAQSQASDMDNWVQFPPRPRPVQAQPQTGPASAPKTAPTTSAVVSTTNERDNWLRFPIRPTAPVAIEPSLTKQADVSVPTPPSSELPKAAVLDPTPKRNEVVPSTANRLAGFKITGNQRLTESAILSELRTLVGAPLTQENLQKATEKVTALYQKNGYLAVAEMPAQDLTSGWAQVKVVEATFAGTVMHDPQGLLANTRLPIDMVEHVQPKGALVSLQSLDKAAALMAEIPGVDTKISLRPGEKTGETQAVASISPSKPIEANIAIDNAGARATGELRESAKLVLNNPLRIGDAASAQLLHSEGLDFHKFSYNLPVGAAGWRAGVNTSGMQYKVVSREFEHLNAKGPSSTNGVDLIIPLLRENYDSVSLQFAYDQKKFKNEAIGLVQSQYTGSAFTAYLEGNHNNGQGGETSASAQIVKGNIDLSGSTPEHQLNDASTTQTHGDYNKLRLALTHKQDIDPQNTLVLGAQTQWANKNLDGSERFYLGGMQGVRAYPTNEAGGSLGNLLSLEWQRHFNLKQQRWTAAGFYDTGRVTVNKNNSFTNAATPNNYGISGAGAWLGTTVRHAYGVSTLRLIASHRLGNNPGASSNGLDQDGSRVLNRYRFSLNHSF